MKQQFFTALAVLALVAGMASSVAAATDDGQRDAEVNVTIAAQTAIDVHPQQLTYPQVTPGQTAGSSVEARSFGAVELENVGSTDIERVWVNATTTNDQSSFFGSSNPSDFVSTQFLQLKPRSTSGVLQGDAGNFTYVNRKEYGAYNDSLNPEYINAPDGGTYYVDTTAQTTATAADVAVGRFHQGSNEYFWALPVKDTPGECDGSSDAAFNSLLVAKQPHNASYTTPVDFTADSGDGGVDPDGGETGYNTIPGRDYYIYNVSELGTNYGVVGTGNDGVSGGVPLKDTDTPNQIRTYDILTLCDTDDDTSHEDTDAPNVIRTRYNVEAGGATDLTGSGDGVQTQYLISSDQLVPGQAVKLNVQLQVPRGIPQGEVQEGVLTIVASTTGS